MRSVYITSHSYFLLNYSGPAFCAYQVLIGMQPVMFKVGQEDKTRWLGGDCIRVGRQKSKKKKKIDRPIRKSVANRFCSFSPIST